MHIIKKVGFKILPSFISLLLFAFSSVDAMAQGQVIDIAANNSFPTNPMTEGMSEIKGSLGYFTYKGKVPPSYNFDLDICFSAACSERPQARVNGGVVGLSYIHAFSPHIGFSLSGAYGEGRADVKAASGSADSLSFGWGTDPSRYSGDWKETGGSASIGIILDPFSDPDGFRMPVSISALYMKSSGDYSIPFKFTCCLTRSGHDGEQRGSYSLSGMMVMLTIPFQFNTGPIRWSPFIDVFGPLKYRGESTVEDINTGETLEGWRNSEERGWRFGAGLPVTYEPWGLSFSVAGFIFSPSPSYILSWTKSW